jgi:hypothetical protein
VQRLVDHFNEWFTAMRRRRTGREGFTTTVLRRAVIELEAYSHEAAAADDINAFLEWLEQRAASQAGQPK